MRVIVVRVEAVIHEINVVGTKQKTLVLNEGDDLTVALARFYKTLEKNWEPKMMENAEEFRVSLIGKNGKAVETSIRGDNPHLMGIWPAMLSSQGKFERGNLDESEKFTPMSEEDAEDFFNEFQGKRR